METTMIAVATLPAKTYMPDDDTALLQASRGGDVAAFEQLVKRYDAKLLRIAQKVTQNPEDAEEAVGFWSNQSTAMLFPTATARDSRLMWPIGHRIPRRNTAQQSFVRFSSALSNV
jgi:hypothetical protein